MPAWLKFGLLPLIALSAILGAVTYFALEGNEVATLRTVGSDGKSHETRVWIAEEGGYLWIESADTQRQFYKDIVLHPEIWLDRGPRKLKCLAAPMTGPDGHTRIRALLAKKYGWADTWVGFLVDTSNSIAIRIEGCQ